MQCWEKQHWLTTTTEDASNPRMQQNSLHCAAPMRSTRPTPPKYTHNLLYPARPRQCAPPGVLALRFGQASRPRFAQQAPRTSP